MNARPVDDDAAHEALLLQVAQMYYEEQRTQEHIGRVLHLTRWKVGRLLVQARDEGIVRVEIVHPRARHRSEEQRLVAAFGLDEAVVISGAEGQDQTQLRSRVAQIAAEYLSDVFTTTALLGVSWGRTMEELARHLPPGWAKGVDVVQLNGGLSRSRRSTSAADVASTIATRAGGTATLLPAPAIVEQADTRQVLARERSVADVMELARRADAHLFSMGAMTKDSVLVESGYLSAADVESLVARGAVGDVLGRFVDADGEIVDHDLDERTLGLGLDELAASPRSIAVLAGEAKRRVCLAALRAGLVKVLITDRATAAYLLERA